MTELRKESNKNIGMQKERLAAAYLCGNGYRILEANYRCRQGEIDLIARDNDVLVFVEVKYRSGYSFGTAAEAVDRKKQRRICYAAKHYLMKKKICWDQPVRFDVVAITAEKIQVIQNAFSYME